MSSTSSSGRSTPIPITVPTDALARRPSRVVVAPTLIEGFALSPKGERALFVGRGDVFSAPIEKGAVRNLTRSSGAHDKAARWSPDGLKIAYISDATGEEELYLIDQAGSGKPEQLTKDGKAMRYTPEWSPDGKRLAFSDKDGKVFVLTLADKSLVQVADEVARPGAETTPGPRAARIWRSASATRMRLDRSTSGASARTKPRRITDEVFDEYESGLGPRRELPLLSEQPRVRTPARHLRV